MHMSREKLKPSDKQLSFLDWEFGLFLHFGIRTFYEGYKDWDGRAMSPDSFLPTELDCSQWIEDADYWRNPPHAAGHPDIQYGRARLQMDRQ